MLIDPTTLGRQELNRLVNGLVAPRPIAWVSTVGEDGSCNLAPFSFFNAFSFDPPVVAVGPGQRSGVPKDSLRNIRETGELTVSLVDEELAERANLSSAEVDYDADEWELAGVTPAPSVDVRPARVAESPAAFECRVRTVVDLGTAERPANGLVIAMVTRIHVRNEALDGLVPRPDVLRLVGRLGGNLWCTTRDRFALERPTSARVEDVKRDVPQRSVVSTPGSQE
ncbi:MAG: flavin reductase family protein [Gaiellaceae bacterium MAG52_C11]|nr:flavin reductase family protein [Candidatus Gaiellasilicea maunaloa]